MGRREGARSRDVRENGPELVIGWESSRFSNPSHMCRMDCASATA